MLCQPRHLFGPLRFVCMVVAFVTSTMQIDAAPAQDAPPLHERIDELIESSQVGPQVPLAGDAVFLRRV